MGTHRLRCIVIRILQIISDMHPKQGGPPVVVNGTAIALKKLGHDVEIACRVMPGEEDEVRRAWPELTQAGIPLHLLPASGPNALIRSRAFDIFMRANVGRFDVLHAHGTWEGVLASAGRAFYAARKPYFISLHGTLDSWSLAQSRWKKRASLRLLGTKRYLNEATGLIFGSKDEADEAKPLGLYPLTQIIPNGVNLENLNMGLKGDKALILARFPATRDWARTILFFSRLHPKKGLDILIAAFARVADDFPGAGLFAAGIPQDKAFEQAVRTRIAELGLENRVVLTTDLVGTGGRIAFSVADIFTLPSHQEGFSMAIIEAMGMGLPVLITTKCHLDEVAQWGAGEVVTPTTDGISAGLRSLLACDPAALQDMGRNGASVVSKHFTWPQIALKLEALYKANLCQP